MSKCGKGCLPECEYFTTGGCISPFNCMYKEESGYINSATSGTVIYTGGMNMTNEEMIENLKCVIADIFEQCEQLKAENAALRERLDKAVELPCKIGDEVYEVHGKCDRKNCVYNGYYGQWRCDYGGKTNCNPFITVNKFRYCDIPMVGKTIFVTKEAAEARLKELKENNND